MNDQMAAVWFENLQLNDDKTISKRNSEPLLEATTQFYKDNYPTQYKAVEDHFGHRFKTVLKNKTTPFQNLQVTLGIITPEVFLETLLRHDKEDRIIVDFLPADQFLGSIDKMYEEWAKVVANPPMQTIEVDSLVLPNLKDRDLGVVNAVLGSQGVSTYEEIAGYVKGSLKFKDQLTAAEKETKATKAEAKKIEKELREAISTLTAQMLAKPFADAEVTSSGELPAGKVVMKDSKEVFGDALGFDMQVPVWEWEGAHPLVPKVDPNYIFRPDLLARVLYALVTNKRAYLQGHTGSGKTTLLEQVAAALNYPFIRINFDSEITRMDLIGRETLVREGETTVTKFVDGLLPTMMSQPCIGCFDEIDFCRPDVAYVMQSVLENNGLRITEDGGREVKPHDQFRMFATGNTLGQGDEHGMYAGARPQSLAFLDRFTVWLQVPYLEEKERNNLLTKHYPSLETSVVKRINKYVTEHLDGFLKKTIVQPISPRGMLAVANAVQFFETVRPGNKNNLKEAMTMVILDRASDTDRPTLAGIVQRIAD